MLTDLKLEFEAFMKSMNIRMNEHEKKCKNSIGNLQKRLYKRFQADVDSFSHKLINITEYNNQVTRLRNDISKLQLSMHDIFKENQRLKEELQLRDKKLIDVALKLVDKIRPHDELGLIESL